MYSPIEMATKAARKIQRSQSRKLAYPMGYDGKFNTEKYYSSLPEFNEVYKDTIKEHDRVRVHAESDCFPYEILRSKAPNQQPEEWEYQKGLYEPTTNTEWSRALNRTKAIGNSQNYSIKWPNDEQREYFYGDYPGYHSIEAFFFDIVREKKINYPNQVAAVMPAYWPTVVRTDEEGNEYEAIDDTVQLEPVVKIWEEEYIVKFKRNEYCLIWREDEHSYYYQDGKEAKGAIFYYFDQNEIREIYQVGKLNDGTPVMEERTLIAHNMGFLPCWKLGGKAVIDDGEVLYRSHFSDAIPHLNQVVRMESNLMMSTYRLAFPIIIAVVDRCRNVSMEKGPCNGGKYADGTTCEACNGSGKNLNHSPTGIYEVAATIGAAGEENKLPMTPPIQFAAPDTAILDHLQRQIDNKRRQAFGIFFEPEQADAGTATGKQIEKEEFQMFLTQFSREFFQLMDMAIEAIGAMRYGAEFEKPEIKMPQNFNFRTYEDITGELATAIEKSLPNTYVGELMKELGYTRFGTSDQATRMIDAQLKIDRLWNVTPLELRAMVGSTATVQEAILHTSFFTIVAQAQQDNEGFWELPTERQKEICLEIADQMALPFTAAAGGATNELSKTVGGLTGFIQIAQAVASGLYDLDAAVQFVSRTYGISEERARIELGTPQLPDDFQAV